MISLCICIAGCAKEGPDNGYNDTDSKTVSTEVASEMNANEELDNDTDSSPVSTENASKMNVNEELDSNLYVETEFQLPDNRLYIYSTELKTFDFDKVQSVFWPDAGPDEITIDEFGARYYKEESLGGEKAFLNYKKSSKVSYIDTLCSYAKEKNMFSEKELRFKTMEEAMSEAEAFISRFDIGCELGKPYIVAVNSEDLNGIQEEIMKDEDSATLIAKNLGNASFDSDTEIYYFEYSFMLNDIPVFGHDDPTVQQSGDNPLLAQNMRAIIMISNSGVEELVLEGVVDKTGDNPDEAEIIGYEGIRAGLEKKFGDVILTEKYKVTNIWMEYFPLIKDSSFTQVELIPVWCCDFEINGEAVNYTIRFHAITGEEIS